MLEDNIANNKTTKVFKNRISDNEVEKLITYGRKELKDLLEKNNIDSRDAIGQIVDASLYEVPHLSGKSFAAYQILDAYSQEHPKEARAYIRENLDLRCEKEDDFYKKQRFTDILFVHLVDKLELLSPSEHNLNLAKEDIVFQELEHAVAQEKGSVLLNFYVRTIFDKYKDPSSAARDRTFDSRPYKVAKDQYAFDSDSSFWMLAQLGDTKTQKGYYVSKPEFYEQVTELLEKYEKTTILGPQAYAELEPYFEIAVSADVQVDSKEPQEKLTRQDLETLEFRELMSPRMRDKIKDLLPVEFSELPLPVLYQLIRYLKMADIEDFERLSDFVEQYKEQGLTSLLALSE